MSKKHTHPYLVWIDCEMSGLNPHVNTLLEVAIIITDENLNVIAEGPQIVISHGEDILNQMDDWNQTHHKASGLWQKVIDSQVSMQQAESQIIEFLNTHISEIDKKRPPLAGNSIGQDKIFLDKYMPQLMNLIHYRVVDVSSVKELAQRWYPELSPFAKAEKHRALDDIRESIEELKYFKKHLFR